MNYSEVLNYITEKNKLGSLPGISAIKELLRRLGNPENKVKALHIAGTNGKGSIMAYVESVLILHGLKVGRYISPAVFGYREKWQINREYISEDKCADIISLVADQVNEMVSAGFRSPTSFEIETAAAFVYFAEEKCDYMLIECGMGGMGDATNVIDSAEIRTLASISYDHMQFLGNTLSQITQEKLGIVRPDETLVSYPQCEEVRGFIDKDAEEKGYNVIYPDTGSLRILEKSIKGSTFSYKGKEYRIAMPGEYQVLNALTAIEVLSHIQGLSLGYDEIYKGVAETVWKGRMSIASEKPLFVVDGAHNRDAWERLAETLKDCFGNKKYIFILGVLADKEYESMLDSLVPIMKKVYTVTTSSPRALGGDVLAELIADRGVEAHFIDGDNYYDRAVDAALDAAYDTDDIIVACGTLSFGGKVMRAVSDNRHNIVLHDPEFIERLKEIDEAEKERRFCRHGLDHLVSVARIGALIAADEGLKISRDKIYATALLHDIGRWSLLEQESDHSEAGALYAEKILRRAGYSEEDISEITHAIRCHGEDTERENSLAWLLYKADKMSRSCFNCDVYEECFWDEDRKNKNIKY